MTVGPRERAHRTRPTGRLTPFAVLARNGAANHQTADIRRVPVTNGEHRMAGDELAWFGVRCVFAWSCWEGKPFEERITLWHARSLDDAIEQAEREAEEYAEEHGSEYLNFSQAYAITEGTEIGSGTEVFSLLRDSGLAPDEYLSTFFSTGKERIQDD
jgi:hypothetical protein